jgi:hypothetical protein
MRLSLSITRFAPGVGLLREYVGWVALKRVAPFLQGWVRSVPRLTTSAGAP